MRLATTALAIGLSLGFMIADDVQAQTTSESDALSLESSEVKGTAERKGARVYVEGAFGNSSQRYRAGSVATNRASLDVSLSATVGSGLRVIVSDRLDQISPRSPGIDETVNSLREAYVSWQSDSATSVLELGRINLRYGPGYGYNPTDFFRDGSLRAITTADPFALRENRMGTVMLRGQRLWDGGSLSLAYSPKLESAPSTRPWSLDLGSTNSRDRWLLALGTQFSPKLSTQAFVYKERDQGATIGANLTALVSDAATIHAEWTHGKEASLLNQVLSLPAQSLVRSRLVAGATYTTSGKLSMTAEYHYNGFGLDGSLSSTLAATPLAQQAYMGEALRRQDLMPRQAVLVYISQKNFGVKDLDLTAYVRVNLADHSRLSWLELRRRWPSFDLAAQLQLNNGRVGSEFGVLPDRRHFQVIAAYYY